MDPEAEDKTTTALHIEQQDVKTSTELISKAKNNKIVKFKNWVAESWYFFLTSAIVTFLHHFAYKLEA